jgi:membrane protein implicated in regulation of membrane protease activity
MGWLWLVAGLLLVGAEFVRPGVFLLWIGVAALATALIALLLPVPLTVQLALFGITLVLACAAGWIVYRRGGARRTASTPRAR